jgi:hypothetical protein
MKSFLLIGVALLSLTTSARADKMMVCEGGVVMGTSVFQKVNGVNTKLRVEGSIGG